MWRALTALGLLAAVVAAALWVTMHQDASPAAVGPRALTRTVAEGFEYRNRQEPFPRATCRSCRVGKRKLGFISLGAFNTVAFEDLVINLPERKAAGDGVRGAHALPQGEPPQPTAPATDFVKAMDLGPLVSMSAHGGRRFSGIEVTGLELNRMRGTNLVAVLKARTLRNRGTAIVLSDVQLYRDSGPEHVPEARFEPDPAPHLVYPGGTFAFK